MRQISAEICRETGRHVFPLYHSVMAPPRGRADLRAVGEGAAIPDSGFFGAVYRLLSRIGQAVPQTASKHCPANGACRATGLAALRRWRRYGLAFPSSDPQNPAFNFGDISFVLGQAGGEGTFETATQVIPAKPFRNGVGVLLMGVAPIAWEAVTPQRRINLNDRRFAWRDLPAIERPEMNPISKAPTEKAQPRNAGVC
jgi:hypothetical protein